MRYSNEWHLDDEGRLHQAMRKLDTTPVSKLQSRGDRMADRIINGVQFIIYAGVAAMMAGFALISLGYIKSPTAPSTPPAVEQVLPNVGDDLTVCQK